MLKLKPVLIFFYTFATYFTGDERYKKTKKETQIIRIG
jgi:hypothetical protein